MTRTKWIVAVVFLSMSLLGTWLAFSLADGAAERAATQEVWESLARVNDGPFDLMLKSAIAKKGKRGALMVVRFHVTNMTDEPREVDAHFKARQGTAKLVAVDEQGNQLLEFWSMTGGGTSPPRLEWVPARGFLEKQIFMTADNFNDYQALVAQFAEKGRPSPKVQLILRSSTEDQLRQHRETRAVIGPEPLGTVTRSKPIALAIEESSP